VTLRTCYGALQIVVLLLLLLTVVNYVRDVYCEQGLMYALKSDECKEMEAKLHQEQMESIFQRDMLQYLIQDKVDVAVDHGVIWQGQLSTSFFLHLEI